MTDTQQLLADYAKSGSEAAFRELVRRYINLVHSTALRIVNGDTHRAQDVTQIVFIDLARQARKLSTDSTLGGWLHRHTCFTAAKFMRGERRREYRESQAAEMNTPNGSEKLFADVAHLLDDAVNTLGDEDRKAILLRFYEQHDLRSVGTELGITATAAQKRVGRALDQLHRTLIQRGVALSATALVGFVTTQAVNAAPAGLSANVAITVLESATATSVFTLVTSHLAKMSTLKIAALCTVIVTAVAVPVIQHYSLNKLENENRDLQEDLKRSGNLALNQAQNQVPMTILAPPPKSPDLNEKQRSELLRLRDEVTRLRQANADREKLRERLNALNQLTEPAANLKSLSDDSNSSPIYVRTYFVNPQTWTSALQASSSRTETETAPNSKLALLQLFHENGIDVTGPGASAFLNTNKGTLIVRSTMQNLDRIEALALYLSEFDRKTNAQVIPDVR